MNDLQGSEFKTNGSRGEGLRYPESFRRQIANRVLMNNESVTKISREQNISQPTINRWVRQYKTTPGDYNMSQPSKTEIQMLQKRIDEQNAQLKELIAYVRKLERILIVSMIGDKNSPQISTLDKIETQLNKEVQQ